MNNTAWLHMYLLGKLAPYIEVVLGLALWTSNGPPLLSSETAGIRIRTLAVVTASSSDVFCSLPCPLPLLPYQHCTNKEGVHYIVHIQQLALERIRGSRTLASSVLRKKPPTRRYGPNIALLSLKSCKTSSPLALRDQVSIINIAVGIRGGQEKYVRY